MEELTERIDLYLKGLLSEEKKADFELAISKDENLANEVRLQQKATELLEANAWLTTKEKVAQLNKKENKKTNYLLRIAAVFIGIVVFSLGYKSYQLSDEQLYSNYFIAYPDRISVMGESSNELENMMNLYNLANYSEAAKAFKKHRESGKESELLLLYEAISLQESGEGSKAIDLISSHKLGAKNLKEVFAWQLIMAHLSIGKNEEAFHLLEEYEVSGYEYQKESAQLLKQDLNSFWKF